MTFVDDSTGTLGTDAIGRINAATSSLDVKVVVASTPSRGDLDQMVGRLVNSANTVAIGVDPVHHYTFTHFGTGTGIASVDYQTIARAGNGEFKAGHWEQGIEAIIASANAASVRTASRSSVIVQQPVTVVERPVSAWPFILGAVAFVLAAVLLVRWLRRRQADQAKVLDGFREEASQMRARNVEEQGWHDKFKATRPDEPMKNASAPDAPLIYSESLAQSLVNRKLADREAIPQPPPRAKRRMPAPMARAKTPEELDREAYLRSRHDYPAAPAASSSVVHYHQNNNGSDLALGYMIGANSAARTQTVVVTTPERHRVDTPAPSSSSSSDWGSSSGGSYDGGSGGGSFDGGSSGGSDGGSGGGDF